MREISVMHNFQGYFSRTFQDLKLQFPGLSRRHWNPVLLQQLLLQLTAIPEFDDGLHDAVSVRPWCVVEHLGRDDVTYS